MVKADFMCLSKTGIETFTVKLAPVLDDVCPVCQKVTSAKFCDGHASAHEGGRHEITEVPNGDRSFFKDLPLGEIFLSVLGPEAGAAFEEGKVTTVSFELKA